MTLNEIIEKLQLAEKMLPTGTSAGLFSMVSYMIDEEYSRVETEKENEEAFTYTLFEFKGEFFDTEEELEAHLESLRQYGKDNNLILPEGMSFEQAHELGIDTMSILRNENTYGSHNSLFARKFVYKSRYEGVNDVVSISLKYHPDAYYAIDDTTKYNSCGLPRHYGISNKGKFGWYNIHDTIGKKMWIGPRNQDILNFFQALNDRNIMLPNDEELKLVKKSRKV